MLTQEHIQTAQEFLGAADEEFAAGDELQGSEKLWGATSHAIMALAQQRDWPFGTHRTLFEAARRLAEELGDEGIIAGFTMAERLHANFYHGHLENYQIDSYREAVKRFVARLLRLVG